MNSKLCSLGGNNFHNKYIFQNSLDHYLALSVPITNKKKFKNFLKVYIKISVLYNIIL